MAADNSAQHDIQGDDSAAKIAALDSVAIGLLPAAELMFADGEDAVFENVTAGIRLSLTEVFDPDGVRLTAVVDDKTTTISCVTRHVAFRIAAMVNTAPKNMFCLVLEMLQHVETPQ